VPQDKLLGERVVWQHRFQGQYLDFRGKSVFTRFDECKFVKCTLLIDRSTEQLAFTRCVFQDCNIESLDRDEERGLYARDNLFEPPLEQRRAEFEKKLAQALATRRARRPLARLPDFGPVLGDRRVLSEWKRALPRWLS
jgi:hypothetical protein